MDKAFADRRMALHAVHCLRFDPLARLGRTVLIPCDERGQVDLDRLSERLRMVYLGARAMIGRDYARPVVEQPH
jgi:hypothetical protein